MKTATEIPTTFYNLPDMPQKLVTDLFIHVYNCQTRTAEYRHKQVTRFWIWDYLVACVCSQMIERKLFELAVSPDFDLFLIKFTGAYTHVLSCNKIFLTSCLRFVQNIQKINLLYKLLVNQIWIT